jgi:hypothetical protein
LQIGTVKLQFVAIGIKEINRPTRASVVLPDSRFNVAQALPQIVELRYIHAEGDVRVLRKKL